MAFLSNCLYTIDLDECATGVDECDQNCANTIGSYTCSCGTGWNLNSDGFHCDGKTHFTHARSSSDIYYVACIVS